MTTYEQNVSELRNMPEGDRDELGCAHDQLKHLTDLESALEDLVSLCNNSGFLSTTNEVMHAEAVLERLYKSRRPSTT